MKERSVRLLFTAGGLMLLAGGIAVFMKGWLYAALLGAAAFGCFAGALNFRNKQGREG
ncbi:MAG: hypothetical protein PUG31_05655 [Eubacteriales bacterium]|nr:hypothetical protein [Clostridiales bacterium]MDD7396888.1 hypothetical protein [Eubacteriales bacterium]